ncbi:MAG: TIGR00159 family protein [Candidatus Omnitrophica bacterium]|nr:TIGR00159 family protein [Candidatus Omnitrophota bacterium]
MNAVLDFLSFAWKPAVEISLFWYAYYVLLKFLRSTGSLQILKGLFLIFLFYVAVQALGLETITKLMSRVLPISVIAFLVVFQTELRRGLTRIGQSPFFKLFLKEERLVDELAKAVAGCSKKRVGALIAIEREISLRQYAESGVSVDALVSFELVMTLLTPNTPLHDGGLILRGTRLDAAGCLFPLSQSQRISKSLGTRHRAALGLSEVTDSVVLVVSEETGGVSVAEKGSLTRDVENVELKQILLRLYQPPKAFKETWASLFREKEVKT